MKTLRLNFPQWQGGESHNIASYIPELSEQDASQGYYLGSRLVSWLVPKKPGQIEADVPVSLDYHDNATANGIFAYDANLRQQTAAIRTKSLPLAAIAPSALPRLPGWRTNTPMTSPFSG